jgi:metaxin
MKLFGADATATATANEVYGKAADALTALAAKILGATPTQGYFFGSVPSSLDASLYSCLLFLSTAPVVHPVLKDKVKEWSCFQSYIARISKEKFLSPVPAASSISGAAWTEWDGSGGASTSSGRARAKERRERGGGGGGVETEAEAAMHRKGRWWLAGTAAVIIAYVIFGAGYFEIGYLMDEDDDDDVDLD